MKASGSRKGLWLVLAGCLVVLAAAGFFLFPDKAGGLRSRFSGGLEEIAGRFTGSPAVPPMDADARVAGETTELVAEVGGRVVSILAREGNMVKLGEVILRLDNSEAAFRIAQARERVEKLSSTGMSSGGSASQNTEERLRTELETLRARESAARRAVEAASAKRAAAQFETRRLDAEEASTSRMNKARKAEAQTVSALEKARQNLEEASRKRLEAAADLQRYRDEVAALSRMPADLLQDRLEQEREILRSAEADYAAATIKAPLSARVEFVAVSPGEEVRHGQVLALLVPRQADALHILAHFSPEEGVAVGDSCSVTFPGGPTLTLNGVVRSVEDAIPDGTSPNSATVRIAIPEYNPDRMPPLRIGMRAHVLMTRE